MNEENKTRREWPCDYPGGPLGQAAGWAIVAILLVVAIGSFVG